MCHCVRNVYVHVCSKFVFNYNSMKKTQKLLYKIQYFMSFVFLKQISFIIQKSEHGKYFIMSLRIRPPILSFDSQ